MASDAERVVTHLTPDVEYVRQGHTTSSGEETRAHIRSVLSNTKFDFLRISHLKAENAFTEAMTAHTEGLRASLFDEIVARIESRVQSYTLRCRPVAEATTGPD